ncbi:MAG: hypothetical protein ACM3ME_09200 [Chloroflexota bacterium]
MKHTSIILLLGLALLLAGCDSFYKVLIINKTSTSLQVKIHYDKPDSYWFSGLDTTNAEVLNSYRADTIIMIVKPDGFILAGSNHGISKFYDAESMYCDYLEIQFDSTTYIATSRKGVINILHNLKKGDRVGEHEIVE